VARAGQRGVYYDTVPRYSNSNSNLSAERRACERRANISPRRQRASTGMSGECACRRLVKYVYLAMFVSQEKSICDEARASQNLRTLTYARRKALSALNVEINDYDLR
jgi:hypothetical protein